MNAQERSISLNNFSLDRGCLAAAGLAACESSGSLQCTGPQRRPPFAAADLGQGGLGCSSAGQTFLQQHMHCTSNSLEGG